MSDPEATNPPPITPQPNTPRNLLKKAYEWLLAHPIWMAGILGFLAGWLLPKVI